MPVNFAFVFGEAEVRVTPSGQSAQVITFATGMSLDKKPVILEDGSVVYRRITMSLDTVWVDDDVKAVIEADGPHTVVVTWTNADDLRLRSEALQDAALTGASLRGALEGGAQVYALTFEGLSR